MRGNCLAAPSVCVTWRITRAHGNRPSIRFGVTNLHSRLIRRERYAQLRTVEPLQTARGISIIAMQLSSAVYGRRFRFSRRQFFHQIYRRSKIRPLQATRNGPQNALILMDLLYNKGEFLSSDKHASNTPWSHNYYINLPFTIRSHIYIFVIFNHPVFFA